MRGRTSRAAGFLFATSLALAPAWADDAPASRSITDVAPANAFALIQIPDWPGMRRSMAQTSFGAMFEDPEIRSFIDKGIKELRSDDAEFARFMDEFKEAIDEVGEPTGSMGLALFLAPAPASPEDDADDGDEEPGEDPASTVAALMVCGFGEKAEAAETRLLALLEDGRKSGELALDERTVHGVEVHKVTFVADTAEDDEADEEDEDDFDFEFEDEDTPPPPLHWARVGETFIAGTHELGFDAAIEQITSNRPGPFTDSELFAESLAQHPRETQVFATFLFTADLRKLVEGNLGDQADMIAGGADPSGIFRALGLLNFRSASIGLRFNTARADAEQTIGIRVPEKSGIFTLFDAPATPFVPPAFVTSEATAVTRYTVRFDKVFETVRGAVAAVPGEMRQQAEGALQTAENTMGPAFRAMGPEVYQVQSITKPFSATSEQSVTAIRCTDELAVNNAIVGFVGMIGLEARDFQGFQIYDSELNPAMAIGIGAGYLFLGNSEGVENALRSAAQPPDSRLADSPRFKAAIAQLRNQGNIYSYTAGPEAIEYLHWSLQNSDKIALEQWRAMGVEIPPEEEAEYVDEVPDFLKEMPPASTFTKYFGDTVLVMESTPDGFKGHSLSLRPAGKQPE